MSQCSNIDGCLYSLKNVERVQKLAEMNGFSLKILHVEGLGSLEGQESEVNELKMMLSELFSQTQIIAEIGTEIYQFVKSILSRSNCFLR